MCRRLAANLQAYVVIFFLRQAAQISLDPRTIIAIRRITFRIFTRVKECHIRAGISFATFSTITKHKWDITYLAQQFSALPSIVNLNNFFSSSPRKLRAIKEIFRRPFLAHIKWVYVIRGRERCYCATSTAKWGEKTSQWFLTTDTWQTLFWKIKITMQFSAASTSHKKRFSLIMFRKVRNAMT